MAVSQGVSDSELWYHIPEALREVTGAQNVSNELVSVRVVHLVTGTTV